MRGIVVDGSQTPVPGVVVQLLDSASGVAARALTNDLGEFRVAPREAGTYRVHTLRIGFRPTDSAPIVLRPGPDVSRRIVLTGLPIGLDTVRVAEHNACRALRDSGAAFAVWEQVRGAVTAAALTAASRSMFTTVIVYERTLEPDERRVRTQTSRPRSGYMHQPWTSAPPDVLHTKGYVVTDPDSITYYAPGLDVLLSPAFVDDHCFRLTTDLNRLGLAFEPTPDRRKTPEIRGTLWLDPKTAELRTLEFSYSNVLPEQEANARGDAAFIRMTNGSWVISHWSIRMPLLERVMRSQASGDNQIKVSAIRLAGGELALVRQGNDTLWTRPLVTLSGSVVDSSTGRPVAGARIRLAGTAVTDSTDSRGRFSMHGVLLGEYTMEVRTPSLDSMNVVYRAPVALTDSSAAIELRIPSGAQFLTRLCGGRQLEWPGIVVGTVSSAGDSVPPRNVQVTAEWQQIFMPAGGHDVSSASVHQRLLETRTDSHGSFLLCGVPVDKMISLTAGAGGAPIIVRVPPAGRVARADLTLSADARADLSAFIGTVVDSSGRPVVAADISMLELSKSAVTDAAGEFRIDGVPAGMQHVLVRHIGYRAIDTSLAFSADRALRRRFELARAVTLDSVIVSAKEVDKRMWSFDENRRLGLGHFLTRADLAKLENGPSTASILETIPGLGVARSKMQGRGWVKSTRIPHLVKPDGLSYQIGARSECYSRVYLDEVLVYNGRDGEDLFDVNSISASQIEAIEYYASPAETPARYSGLDSPCGVLVIWTRRSR